ncbi:MAG: GNAT family N-acetyltransferase [Myxococcota bacterium]
MDVRRATRDDLEAVAPLLAEASLAPLPPHLPLQNCLVALDEEKVVGAVALEVRGLRGLLCALVVAPGHRRHGLGGSLVESILARAHELSLRDLYVLPGDEESFFTKQGFLAVDSDDMAPEIRSTLAYRAAGPEPPAVMRFPLATRCV